MSSCNLLIGVIDPQFAACEFPQLYATGVHETFGLVRVCAYAVNTNPVRGDEVSSHESGESGGKRGRGAPAPFVAAVEKKDGELR